MYLCDFCGEVSLGELSEKNPLAIGMWPNPRKPAIHVDEECDLEEIGKVKVIQTTEGYIRFEETDGSSTQMACEEFQSLKVQENSGNQRINLTEENMGDHTVTSDFRRESDEKRWPEADTEAQELVTASEESKTTRGFSFDSLEAVRKKLIDLTSRNNLLNYRHPRASCLRLIDELPDQIVEILSADKQFTFIPVPEPTESELIRERFIEIDPVTREKKYRDYPTAEQWAKCIGLATSYELPDLTSGESDSAKHQDTKLQTLMYAPELESRCRSIRSKAETAIEESGANILYLVLGFLEWYESRDSGVIRLAPLFTLPVRMERKKYQRGEGTYRYTISQKDDGLLTNVPLREKLANDFGLVLPEIEEEETPEGYFNKIRQTILLQQPRWKIRREATLALLNFSKQVMYEDLEPSRWPADSAIQNHPILKRFFDSSSSECCPTGGGYTNEHDIDEIVDIHQHFPLVYDADSSQHSALIDAVKGDNLVIEGPPGSGKSQTITNLVAASIANGKNVLFVAEKMAALEVVKNRLDQAGVGDFCLELHSHKTQKLQILESLETRLSNQVDYRSPRDIEVDIKRYEDLKGKLQKYVRIINSLWKDTGLTVHEILNRATRYRDQLKINPDSFNIDKVDRSSLAEDKVKELFDQTEMLANIYDQVASQTLSGEITDHYWYGINNKNILGHQIDELCELTSLWNEHLTKLKEVWTTQVQNLKIELPENVNTDAVDECIGGIEALPALTGDEPLACVEQLLGRQEELECYLNNYRNIHHAITNLRRSLALEALNDVAYSEEISTLLSRATKMNISHTASLQEINNDLETVREILNKVEVVNAGFQRITPKVPDALKVALNPTQDGLKEFLRLVELIEVLPKDLWRNRATMYDDEDLDSLLDQMKPQFELLVPLHSKLIEVFSLHRLPGRVELQNDWQVFQNGGVLRIFSSSWRNSRKKIFSLASSTKPNKKAVIDLMPELLEYVDSLEVITELNHQAPVLGDLFNGAETPLDRVINIRNWYKAVRAEYGKGFGARVAIGDALLSLDRNLALGILDFAKQELREPSKEILRGTEHLRNRFPGCSSLADGKALMVGEESSFLEIDETFSGSLEKLKHYILPPDSTLQDLSKILRELESCQEHTRKWKKEDVGHLLSTHDLSLSVSHDRYSGKCLKKAENILSVVQVLNRYSFLQHSITQSPTLDHYQDLMNSAAHLKTHLSACTSSQSRFIEKGSVSFSEWSEAHGVTLGGLIAKNTQALERPEWLQTWLDYIKVVHPQNLWVTTGSGRSPSV